MKISDALQDIVRLYFDSAPLIYYLENHPKYAPKMRIVFQQVESENLIGVTSTLTLAEVLVAPFKQADVKLAQQYKDLLYNTSFETIPINSAIGEQAAQLRAMYKLKTPDALQLAAAIHSGCGAFLSNDYALQRIPEITVLILDDLEL